MMKALQLATTAILLHTKGLIITMKSTALMQWSICLAIRFSRNPSFIVEGGATIQKASMFDWSCGARNRKLLEKAGSDPAQKRITEFYNIVTDIEKLIVLFCQ